METNYPEYPLYEWAAANKPARLTPQSLTSFIQRLTVEFVRFMKYEDPHYTAEQINAGDCQVFADIVRYALPQVAVHETDWGGTEPSHEFIVYEGRCYDSDAPHGVDHYYDLPIFRGWKGWGDGKKFKRNPKAPKVGYAPGEL